MNRRGFLTGILAAGAAPWVCTKAGVLMPVRQIVTPVPSEFEMQDWQRDVLRRLADRVSAEMYINPPLIQLGSLVAQFQADCKRLENLGWVEVMPMPNPRARVRV